MPKLPSFALLVFAGALLIPSTFAAKKNAAPDYYVCHWANGHVTQEGNIYGSKEPRRVRYDENGDLVVECEGQHEKYVPFNRLPLGDQIMIGGFGG